MVGVRSRVCHATRPAGFGAPDSPAGARRGVRRSTSRHGDPWLIPIRNPQQPSKEKPSNTRANTAVGMGYPMYPLGPTCTPSAWSGPLKHSITSLRIPRRSDTFFFVRSATDVVQQSKSKCHSNDISHLMCRLTKRFTPGIRTLNWWIGGLCQSSPTALRSVTITG